MRNLFVLSALVAAGAAIATPAVAQEAEGGPSISGNVALTTDYQWRNVSQSNQDQAIQGGLDFDSGMGFYAGTWASSLGSDAAPSYEIDFYAGYAFEVAGFGLDVGAIHYAYPDDSNDNNEFTEVYVAASKDIGALGLGTSVSWDPDNETIYADVSGSYALMETLSVSGGYGTYLEDNDLGLDAYTGFNVGGTFSTMGVDLDLRYYSNDATGDLSDNVVFSIAKSL